VPVTAPLFSKKLLLLLVLLPVLDPTTPDPVLEPGSSTVDVKYRYEVEKDVGWTGGGDDLVESVDTGKDEAEDDEEDKEDEDEGLRAESEDEVEARGEAVIEVDDVVVLVADVAVKDDVDVRGSGTSCLASPVAAARGKELNTTKEKTVRMPAALLGRSSIV